MTTSGASKRVFLVTVQGHDGTTVQTLRFSTDGIMTGSGDSPSNTYFEPRIIDPGNFERHLFSEGQIRGQSQVGSGDVVLASSAVNNTISPDDTLDYMLPWYFDGRTIIIQSLETSDTPLSDAITLFTGTIEQLISTNAFTKLAIKIHDALSDLSKPLCSNSFGGTTTGIGTVNVTDGNVEMTGVRKQKIFGSVYNVEPQSVNPFALVYQFSDGPIDSVQVYDGGAPLTNGGDHATLFSLFSSFPISAGSFQSCVAEGIIVVGSTPVFQLTGDVNGNTNLISVFPLVGFDIDIGYEQFVTKSYSDTFTPLMTETSDLEEHLLAYLITKSATQKTYRFSGKFACNSSGSARHVRIAFGDSGLGSSPGSHYASVYYNLTTGAFIGTKTNGSYSVISHSSPATTAELESGNQFWEIELEFLSGTDTSCFLWFSILDAATTSPDKLAYAGDGTSGVLMRELSFVEEANYPAGTVVRQMLDDFYGGDGTEIILNSPDQFVLTGSTLITGAVNQVKEDSSSGQHWLEQIIFKDTKRVYYTGHVDLKPNGRNYVRVQMFGFGGNAGIRIVCDLSLGVISAGYPLVFGATLLQSATLTNVGSGFYRLDFSFATDDTHLFSLEMYAATGPSLSPDGAAYLGNGSSGFFFKNLSLMVVEPIDEASFTALNLKNSATCGILVSGETTVVQAIQQVLDSVGGYLIPDREGILSVGRFEAPGSPSTSVAVLDESAIVTNGIQRIGSGADGTGIPSWQIIVKYAKNYTIQAGSQLAGSVASNRRGALGLEWYTTSLEDLTIQNKSLLAKATTIETCLVSKDDADTEAARLLTLYSSKRESYRITVWLDYADDAEVGTIVTLQSPRFGLTNGKDFIVIGRIDNYLNNTLQLDLWG